MPRRTAVPALLACALWSAIVALPAFAAEPTAAERETARGLLKEGDWLFASKKYDEALERYRAAHGIMGLPSTGMAVVRCLSEKGRLVEARDLAVQIARSAPVPNENRAMAEARAEAGKAAAALEPRIPVLTLRVSGLAQGQTAHVVIDGIPIPDAAIGQPWKLDPGKHAIEARAEGMATRRLERDFEEGARAAVDVALEPEASAPAGAAQVPAPLASSAPAVPGPVTSSPGADKGIPAVSSGRPPTPVLGYALAGVGAASVAAGLAFGWKALERKSYRDDHCDATGCDQSAIDADGSGRTWATWSTVATGIGAAALGAGLYVILSAPKGRAPATATLTPLGPAGAAVTLKW